MGPEESWQIVESHRYAIADIIEALEPARWELPSLCAEWRLRDVVATSCWVLSDSAHW
jgi:hypothetical protein